MKLADPVLVLFHHFVQVRIVRIVMIIRIAIVFIFVVVFGVVVRLFGNGVPFVLLLLTVAFVENYFCLKKIKIFYY